MSRQCWPRSGPHGSAGRKASRTARPRMTTHDRPTMAAIFVWGSGTHPIPGGFRGLNCLARLALARERTPSSYKCSWYYVGPNSTYAMLLCCHWQIKFHSLLLWIIWLIRHWQRPMMSNHRRMANVDSRPSGTFNDFSLRCTRWLLFLPP